MMGQTIAILGGGIGGLIAANELRRLLPSPHRVLLVEKDLRHAFAPSFLWVMVGNRRPEQIVRDLRTLTRRGVEVVQAVRPTSLLSCRLPRRSDPSPSTS